VAVASLSQAGSELEAIRSGHFGEVSVGAITAPAIGLLPQAMSILAREHPHLRVRLIVESSDVLLERLSQSKLDIMIGRLTGAQDKTTLSYERLADEPVCAVARAGHRMLDSRSLTLKQLERASWIVPPMGSVLRHRFEMMFHEASLEVPTQLIETSSVLFMTKMLQQSDFIAVVPIEVARYYASYGMVAILPVELSCAMDDFGIILRNDWLLSPAGVVTLDALRTAAHHVFGTAPPGKSLR
jgi:DNA-binding transcriptional LysR family regulator